MGAPFKRGEKWYCVVELDRAADGKRRQKWVKGPTKRECLAAAAALAHARNTGTAADPSKQTVAAFVAEWLETERHRLEETTATNYAYIIKGHIAPHFARLRLDQITPTHAAKFLAAVQDKGLSDSRVVSTWSILHHALRDAVRLQKIARNPCDAVAPPKRGKIERAIWDEPTARRFLARIADDKNAAIYTLIIGTGLRQGEVLGVRWQDIDLARGSLVVRQALARLHGKGQKLKGPKSSSSRRSVTLPAFTIGALRAHKARQNAARLALGDVWEETDLVFCGPGGAMLPIGTFQWQWGQLRRKLVAEGYPYCTFHDLRHLHATLGLAAGIHPKVMSERLGHSSVSITLDLYSHVTETMQARAAEAFDAIMRDDGDGDGGRESAD